MTYAELKTQFEGLLKRRDLTTTLRDFWLQEALSRCTAILRIPAMEASYETDSAEDTVTIPTDFLELRSIVVTDASSYSYELAQRDLATVLRERANSGCPRYFTRRGGEWLLAPTPEADTALRVDYYGEFEDLVDDEDENLLSIIKPFAIIYAALASAAIYFMDKRAPAFEAKFQEQITELHEQRYRDELTNAAVAPAIVWASD